jgi:hypothetical protein
LIANQQQSGFLTTGREQNIEPVLTTLMTARSLNSLVSPFRAFGILSSLIPSHTPSSFHPSKPVGVRLWSCGAST